MGPIPEQSGKYDDPYLAEFARLYNEHYKEIVQLLLEKLNSNPKQDVVQ